MTFAELTIELCDGRPSDVERGGVQDRRRPLLPLGCEHRLDRRELSCRYRRRGGGAGHRIRRIGPVDSRQVVQSDPHAPAVGGRPHQHRQQHRQHRQAQHRMRTDHAEIDHDDDRADGKPIAEDDEGPRVPGIGRRSSRSSNSVGGGTIRKTEALPRSAGSAGAIRAEAPCRSDSEWEGFIPPSPGASSTRATQLSRDWTSTHRMPVWR